MTRNIGSYSLLPSTDIHNHTLDPAMSLSRADRLNKLFEQDSLPPLPDPNRPHIADTEIIWRKQPVENPRQRPRVAEKQVNNMQPSHRGRQNNADQPTSSDEDEYLRAFSTSASVHPKVESRSSGNGGKKTANPSWWRSGHDGQVGARLNARFHAPSWQDTSQDSDDRPLLARFCPLTLVTKFCYKYMDDPDSRVSKRFFASGKIWTRTWEIHYIHPPASLPAKHILVVPERQVQVLIDEINSDFSMSIQIPPDPFLLPFYQDGTPSPTRLGVSRSRDAIREMEQQIAPRPDGYGEPPVEASAELERPFEQFKEKMERASAALRRQRAAAKTGRAMDRLAAHANWCEALKRGQRYLGLRPADCKDGLPIPDPLMSLDEQQKFEREQQIAHGPTLLPLDPESVAPHPFERQVVFVSVDVEAFERDHSLITEVGVSTLDTVEIQTLAPGRGGLNWMECIRSRHFRIREHQHLRNTSYCIGDPDRFLFGRSEFVSRSEVGRLVDSCFEPPYSKDVTQSEKSTASDKKDVGGRPVTDLTENRSVELLQAMTRDPEARGSSHLQDDLVDTHRPTNAEQHLANQRAVSNMLSLEEVFQITSQIGSTSEASPSLGDGKAGPPNPLDQASRRNVILVGHDLEGDLQHLALIESKVFRRAHQQASAQPGVADVADVPSRQHILESFDTARLYQAFKRESNFASLANILMAIERTGWQLHNGGNDARYTLEAAIGILVRARLQGDESGR